MGDFQPAEAQWIDGLGRLRNAVRQELIARQLADHVPSGATVLDVGCGQGTQAILLAGRGCTVTGVDVSPRLLARLTRSATDLALPIEALVGSIESLSTVLDDRRFDVVCAHGLLMYLDDVAGAIGRMAEHVADGGMLSLTFRNGHALAFRPGIRGDWEATLAAFDQDRIPPQPSTDATPEGSVRGATSPRSELGAAGLTEEHGAEGRYINELGVAARAHGFDEISAALESRGFAIETWYGVRVFNDGVARDTPVPGSVEEFSSLVEAEDRAGRRDPYRWMASQLHVVARRGAPTVDTRNSEGV